MSNVQTSVLYTKKYIIIFTELLHTKAFCIIIFAEKIVILFQKPQYSCYIWKIFCKFAIMIKYIITSFPLQVCFFWSVVLLLDWFRLRSADKLRLLAFSLATTVLYAGHYIYFNQCYSMLPLSDTLYSAANLMVFPLYYLYIKEVTEGNITRRLTILLLMPAVIMALTLALCYGMMPQHDRLQFVSSILYGHDMELDSVWTTTCYVAHLVAKIVFAMQIPPVIISGYRKINRYDSMVKASYADVEDKQMYHINTVMVLMMMTSLASFAVNILGRQYFTVHTLWLAVPSLIFSVLLFMLFYAGHLQYVTVREVREEIGEETRRDSDAPSMVDVLDINQQIQPDNIDVLKDKIERLMTEEKMYLKPNLKISDVARRLMTNRDYIYKAVNVRSGMSFSDYVNRYRVEYAAHLLRTQPEMSIQEVAVKSGYTSLASFYRNFKNIKHCTPKEWYEGNEDAKK